MAFKSTLKGKSNFSDALGPGLSLKHWKDLNATTKEINMVASIISVFVVLIK